MQKPGLELKMENNGHYHKAYRHNLAQEHDTIPETFSIPHLVYEVLIYMNGEKICVKSS